MIQKNYLEKKDLKHVDFHVIMNNIAKIKITVIIPVQVNFVMPLKH
jgi:hypothetical protein